MRQYHRIHRDLATCFFDASRYYKNAKGFLRKSEIEYGVYKDRKLVIEACGIGYLSVLEAINGYLLKSSVESDKLHKSYNAIMDFLHKYSRHNGKLVTAFLVVYDILHIAGYYRGDVDVNAVKSGFEKAKFVIEHLTGKKL